MVQIFFFMGPFWSLLLPKASGAGFGARGLCMQCGVLDLGSFGKKQKLEPSALRRYSNLLGLPCLKRVQSAMCQPSKVPQAPRKRRHKILE